MPTWTITADRRRIDHRRLMEYLRALGESIDGLRVTAVDIDEFESAPDRGNLRDFAPVARLDHRDIEALEIAAEEVIAEFGWLVDLRRR